MGEGEGDARSQGVVLSSLWGGSCMEEVTERFEIPLGRYPRPSQSAHGSGFERPTEPKLVGLRIFPEET